MINDPATGLTYLGNGRYYDPSLGRPLQPNPAGGAPAVPQSLNRYAATPLGQPGVAEAVVNSWNPFEDVLLSNLGKASHSLFLSEATAQGSLAYFRASAYAIPGRPIWGNQPLLTPASSAIERGLLGLGMVGLAAREAIGAPPGSLRARLFNAGAHLFERAALWNSEEVTLKVIVGYEFSYGHRLPMGRAVGRLAMLLSFNKVVGHVFDFGIGLGIDVGYQAWMDYENPYLTRTQFMGRLLVAGGGSATSFVAGLIAPSIFGGPVTWVALGTGITVAIFWDYAIAPVIYDAAGLNPERHLAPLQ